MKKITAFLIVSLFLSSVVFVYASDGDVIWAKPHDSGNYDYSYKVAIDSSNNVIVTGYVTIAPNVEDYYTIKYDPSGNQIWAKPYHSGSYCEAFAVAIDSSNNVIVTGYVLNSSSNWDYYTIKYDPSGNQIWAKTYDGGIGQSDFATGVATDSSNNVIVTGYSDNGTSDDYYTIKYDPSGNQIWAKAYDRGIGGDDQAWGVATDSYNNVIVTGYSNGASNEEYYTIKYDPSGNQIWAKAYNGGIGINAQAWGVATDSSNNVIVTGRIRKGAFDDDYYTIKYDSSGNQIWAKAYDSGGEDSAKDVATDSYNNVIVTGYSDGASNEDYYTIKYDPSGNQIWAKAYDGGGEDNAWGVATDSYNNVIVTGYSNGASNPDYYTIKYQGTPPKNKSLPIHSIMRILGLLKE